MTGGPTLDTGALIAAERGDARMVALLDRAATENLTLAVPAGVLAQAWRGGTGRQARLARLMSSSQVDVVALDEPIARAVGVLLAASGTADVVDASVVLCAADRGHGTVVTSDPEDLRRISPDLRLAVV